jgi:ACS family hexuronate transporter-like MFS transporter
MAQTAPSTRLKWWVLGLCVLAGMLNYIDRQVISILKPVLQAQFGWSDMDYGHLGTIFQFSAAVSSIGIGYVIDRVGLRRAFPAGVAIWSLACMAHGAANSLAQFMVARVVLAAAETVERPASMKAIAENVPPAERSLAVGIVNMSANFGAIIAPLLVPLIVLSLGWRAAFVLTGSLGIFWLLAWSRVATTVAVPPSVASAGAPDWRELLRERSTWAIVAAKALTDLVWWFLLFWAPDFFHRQFHLDITSAGPPLAAIYGLAALGSLSGGLLPTFLRRLNFSHNAARKLAMLGYALLITPLPLVLQVQDPWQAVLFIGMALFAHQGFSTNIFSIAVEALESDRVATVISLGALAGNTSGMLMLEFTGWVLTHHQTYWPMFAISACVYLLALGVIQVLLPRLEIRI